MSDDAKLKEAAERYATGNYYTSFPDTFEMNAFIAGGNWMKKQVACCPACGESFDLASFTRMGVEVDKLRTSLAAAQAEVKRLHDKYDHQFLVKENDRLKRINPENK